MKTLKYLIGAAAAVALLATGSPAFAVDDIAGTKHDLSTGGGGTVKSDVETGICVFCHTPHVASATAKPLWNRTINTSGYTMYNADWSSTIGGAVDSQPGGVSAACLSCHDGSIALDALLNPPGAVTPATFADDNAMAGTETGEEMLATSSAMLGMVLTNDHPISIAFAVTANEFQAPTNAKIFNDKVECGSCHSPHDATLVPFLRTTNAASALCLDCHLK